MSTVVFIVDSSVSHGYSSAGLARRLAARGMNVEYWGALRNDFDRLVENQGFTFRAIDGLWPRFHEEIRLPPEMTLMTSPFHVPELLRGFKARRRWKRELPAALDRVERSLDALLALARPAFVVLDPFVLAYYPLLWAKRLPTVVLSTKPLPIRDPIVPPYDSSVLPTDTPLGRARVALAWVPRIMHDLELRALKAGLQRCRAYTYLDILRQCSARTGFPLRAELVHRWLQPDLNFRSLHEWALWTPSTDLPRRRPLPANAQYVGPSVDLSRAQPPSPAAPRRARYRIYVAVGTIRARWKSNVPFLAKVLRAFGDLPDTEVILSTGDERTTKALGRPPGNFQVFDFLPQLRILADVDLVVTHAGAGTYRECVERQVPMLAYPRNHDQTGNAVRIAHHRIGLRGSRRRDSVETIRRKALRILEDPSFRTNIGRLRDSVHRDEDLLLTRALAAVGVGGVGDRVERGVPLLASM